MASDTLKDSGIKSMITSPGLVVVRYGVIPICTPSTKTFAEGLVSTKRPATLGLNKSITIKSNPPPNIRPSKINPTRRSFSIETEFSTGDLISQHYLTKYFFFIIIYLALSRYEC